MKTLSIVIPVYNEEERLEKTFKALSELRVPRGLKLEKVIFVDDGSTDSSKLKIQQFILRNKKTFDFILIPYKTNRGRGYALKLGLSASHSDYSLYCDVDMSTPFSELEKFNPLMQKETPIIIGTRKNGKSTVIKHQPLYREILGRCYTKISNLILGTKITDFTCGFKAFSYIAKNELLTSIKMNRWGFDSEIIYLAYKYKYKIVEVPVVWSDDSRSKVKIWQDIPISLYELIIIRLLEEAEAYKRFKTSLRLASTLEFLRTIKTLIF